MGDLTLEGVDMAEKGDVSVTVDGVPAGKLGMHAMVFLYRSMLIGSLWYSLVRTMNMW